MNKIVEKAKVLDQFNSYIPELEVNEVVEINDVWDGEGEVPESSYSYHLTDNGEDGESNCPVDINYEFVIIEEKENPLETVIKITNIQLI